MLIVSRIFPKNLIKSYFSIFYYKKAATGEKIYTSWKELVLLFCIAPLGLIYFSCSPKIFSVFLALDNVLSIGIPVFTGLYVSYLLSLRISIYPEIKKSRNMEISIYDKELMTLSGMGIIYCLLAIILYCFIKYFIYQYDISLKNFTFHHHDVLKVVIGLMVYFLVMLIHCFLALLKRVFRDIY